MRIHKLLMVSGLMLGCAGLAGAQAGDWEASLAPGYAIPVGSASDYVKGAAALDGSAAYQIDNNTAVGLELGYIFGAKLEGTAPASLVGDVDGDGITDPIGFTSDIKAGVLHITPQIKFGPTFEEADLRIRPYVVAGGGWYRTHFNSGTLTLTGTTSNGTSLAGFQGQVASQTDSNGGINVGAGFEIETVSHLLVGVDVRYHHIIYNDEDDVAFLVPSLKLTWAF